MSWLHSATTHLVLVAVWLLLLYPTFTVWQDSILWVAFISVYANVVSHWGAYQAARAEDEARKKNKK